jgi:hypothetical protein
MASIVNRVRRGLVPGLAVLVLVGAFAGVAASSGAEQQAAAPGRDSADHALVFLDHLADELGVERAELLGAVAQAGEATIDDLQSHDLLTSAQARLARGLVRRAASDPSSLEPTLRRLRMRLEPYGGLAAGLKRSVARSLASLLGVTEKELARRFVRSEISEAAARAGVTRAEVLAATRRAARHALGPAVDRGLITATQASIVVTRSETVVAHHW